MNLLIDKGIINEIECGINFAYVLKDSSSFLLTEYKVLQNQTNGSLIKCMRMLYNGKTALYYLVGSFSPLSAILSHIEPDHFLTIVQNLFASVIAVKSNGFLTCLNIDSSFEHIYVEQNTFKTELVYLPLNQHEYNNISAFENVLRANLVQAISAIPSLSSQKVMELSINLQNGMLSIEDIYAKLRSNSGGGGNAVGRSNNLKLVALNAPTAFEFEITKPEFLIGQLSTNDGIIFNKTVNKVHCKVSRSGQNYLICDLQSKNGTFVNGIRLLPNCPVQIKNGDMIRFASSVFQAVIE